MKSALTIAFLFFVAIYAISTAVLYIRCLSHLRAGYSVHLWNPAWIFDRESVEDCGQHSRRLLVLVALSFPVVAFTGASLLERL